MYPEGTHYFFDSSLTDEELDRQWMTYGPWIRPTKAAKALGVRTETVRRWADSGFIRYCEESGGYTYNANDICRLVELFSGYQKPGLWLLKLKTKPACG